jgi:hypothetical protein
MKTENFDDAFRQKMESISFDITTNAEVDAVHSYVLKNTKTNNYKKIAVWFVAIANIGLMVMLLFWNYAQFNQNKQLTTSIAALNTNVNELKTENNNIKKTLLLTANIITTGKRNFKANFNNNTYTNIAIASNNLISQKTNVINNKTKNNTTLLHANYANTTSAININNSTKPLQTLITVASIPAKHITINATYKAIDSATCNSVKIDSAALISENTTSTTYTMETETQQVQLPKMNKSNMGFEIGLGTDNYLHKNGLSAMAKVNFNSKWSGIVGCRLLIGGKENFKNDKDFKNYKHNSFNTHYQPQHNDTNTITNININKKVTQIILVANYTTALKKQYSIVMGLGTYLNIASAECIKYSKDSLKDGNNDLNKLKQKNNVTVFNNAFISVGLQKKWHKIAIQLSPIVNATFEYKTPTTLSLGADFKLYYTLK